MYCASQDDKIMPFSGSHPYSASIHSLILVNCNILSFTKLFWFEIYVDNCGGSEG
jgi:hypothetical protein